jgi:glycosyltransferase involved in cell wall biosynthesis
VVTPVRDEVAHIRWTLDSLARQTLLPRQWVVVDDGSTDGTGDLVERVAAGHSWMKVVRRPDRGHRSAGAGVMEAFHAGFAEVREDWDYLVKLDGDLSFDPDYFRACLHRFELEPKLGIGGGTVCRHAEGGLCIDVAGDPPFHVRGATKIYTRGCWDDIGPPVKAPGWDTIDEIRANLFGWTTRTFSDLNVVQHKPTGAAAGRWGDAFKNGRANYMTGYHPAFMLAKCAKRGLRNPPLVESAALLGGYLSGYVRRLPRAADDATVRYVRQQQVRRLLLRPSIYG